MTCFCGREPKSKDAAHDGRLEAIARQMAYSVRRMGFDATPVARAYADAFYREFPQLTEESVTATSKDAAT